MLLDSYLFSFNYDLIVFVILARFAMQELGKFCIVCIEDIVHQIDNVGPRFVERIENRYKDGGDAGSREDLINEVVSKMN